jgi:hypothetical protein
MKPEILHWADKIVDIGYITYCGFEVLPSDVTRTPSKVSCEKCKQSSCLQELLEQEEFEDWLGRNR